MTSPTTPRSVTSSADVTEDVLEAVREIESGWYADVPIDWEDVWDRLERWGTYDFGTQVDTPAMRKIQRVIRAERRAG